jgi:hypothetical protein
MKKTFLLLFCISLFTVLAFPHRSEAQLLSGYNRQFYPTIFEAAEGVAMPFLLQQGYKTMPGVTIHNDTMLSYNGDIYAINNRYQNPEAGNKNGYYLTSDQYAAYQIEIFRNVWHLNIPNVFYNYTEGAFYSWADCVGFGTRLLSSVGDTTEDGNGYLSLIKTVRSANTTMMAVKGYVASAYEIGAAFAILPDVNQGGWEYVSGNVITDSINAYNHRVHPNLNDYDGRIKGGYNNSRAGDILAFSYAPGGESNGHFMVMADEPYLMTFDSLRHFYPDVSDSSISEFLNTYNVYGTPVYDCSGREAHFHDSRTYTSGIGHGTLWMLTDPRNETPVGLIFKTPLNTATEINAQMLNDTHTWAITVGRFTSEVTGSGNNGNNHMPETFTLDQNYPNPFNPSTSINFSVPKTGLVKLSVYDALGREVEMLTNGVKQQGSYEVTFDASGFNSGVYFYRLSAGEFSQTKKMILIK